jgi:hypothetical protein
MDDLSDTQIRANLRSVLAEAGIDPNKTTFTCTSGTVRLLGDLLDIHRGEPVRSAQVSAVESSIRRTKGVRRVHLHLEHWERSPSGEWVPIVTKDGRKSREPRSDE